MKKTRTLGVCWGKIYYRGILKGKLTYFVRDHFELPCNGKVRITIEEKGPYTFGLTPGDILYEVRKDSQYIGIICRDQFDRLFFKPDERKNYSIVVKKER